MEKDCPNCKFELYEADKIPRKDCGMDDREYWQPKPQTNADRIREMSDEELAWELMTWRCEAVAKHHGVESQYPDTQKTILSWLKKPQRRISDDSFAPHATTCNFPK